MYETIGNFNNILHETIGKYYQYLFETIGNFEVILYETIGIFEQHYRYSMHYRDKGGSGCSSAVVPEG